MSYLATVTLATHANLCFFCSGPRSGYFFPLYESAEPFSGQMEGVLGARAGRGPDKLSMEHLLVLSNVMRGCVCISYVIRLLAGQLSSWRFSVLQGSLYSRRGVD